MGLLHSQFSYIFSQIRYAICPPNIAQIAHLIVEVEQGKLRGKESIAKYSRKKYCSFLGIPYAKPPVGNLRFMPPEDCDPWDTLYDATYERSDCMQYDALLMLTLGGEDCLHMNIFTPQPPKMIRDLLPVMVFLHGGGYCCGSGSRKLYGADFLINHDVILVAPNFRLNVFGFLNLGIKECPGNVGLKDIIFSLQWVKRNIQNFGGDPDNITLFGQSAGASAVRCLQITPLARGLFSKAIIQSPGTCDLYRPHDDPIEMAFKLGAKLGYLGTDRLKLVQHLRKLSCSELFRAVSYLIDDKVTKIVEFGPSVESIAEGAVMPPDFEELAKHSTPMPTIYGCMPAEGSVLLIVRKSMQRRIRDCMKLLTENFKMNPELYPAMEKEMRKIYFGDKQVANSTADQLIDLLTDMFVYTMPDDIISLINTKAPIYLYRFTYLGRLNLGSVMMRLLFPWLSVLNNFKKAQHVDELAYLFHVKLAVYPPLSDSNKKMIHLITTMWTNFAKTGDPSTSEVKWKPTTHDDMCYLEINDESEMKSGTIYAETLVKLHELLDPVVEKFL
ncbi:juvenile hormone esterase-like isoform X1 [Planococcus citri]|uniref:juvenile hormone esterase-like isoform X1 n=2 Tax=Planococcus citri TaxID=170843 RepID=UPI0031F8A7D4